MIKDMQIIEPQKLDLNFIELISHDWMLISAGDKDNLNTMTASWGYFGFYANKPSAAILVRPERYTREFIDANEYFTLSFFSEDYKKALTLLGTKSGRDCNKIDEAGLTPTFTEMGNPTFNEARIIMECRRQYGADMVDEGFNDRSLIDTWYNPKKGNLHRIYIGEIVNVWVEKA